MRPFTIATAIASLSVLCLAHCGSDSGSNGTGSGSGNLNDFLGTWMCDTETTVKITKPAGMPESKEPGTANLEITKSGSNEITVGEMGDSTCSLKIKVSGSTGSLASSVSCDQGGVTFDINTAKVTVSGDKLTGTRSATVSGTADDGSDISGTATTTIDCTRTSAPVGADAGDGNTGSGGKTGSGGGGNAGSGAAPGAGGAGVDACMTATDCQTCCESNFPDGASALDSKLLDCACAACGTECATSLCAADPSAPSDGDACANCAQQELDGQGTCAQDAVSACRAEADCTPFYTCLANCPTSR
jgi:hypothetical protein